MKKLYFIRHGLSELNVAGLKAGLTDTPLVDEGRRQAHKAGQQAKSLGIDCIVTSPLSRALETAQIIAGQIGYSLDKIIISDLLIERNLGEHEQTPWTGGTVDYNQVAGAEDDATITKRAQKALNYINSLEADHILVVSHSAMGRALRHVLHEIPLAHRDLIPNAEILCWVEEGV